MTFSSQSVATLADRCRGKLVLNIGRALAHSLRLLWGVDGGEIGRKEGKAVEESKSFHSKRFNSILQESSAVFRVVI